MIGHYGLILFVLVMGVAGCAGSPARLAMMSPDELAAVRLPDLCNAYSSVGGSDVEAEILRRQAITDDEWELVRAKKIAVGMSTCALLASWGAPSTINTSASRAGERQQWVYGICQYCKRRYVYVRGGEVIGWN